MLPMSGGIRCPGELMKCTVIEQFNRGEKKDLFAQRFTIALCYQHAWCE